MQKISSLLLALIACAGTIFADGTKIDDLYYNLNADNKTAEVTSMPRGKYTGGIIIPASVEYNSSTYSVTSIGERAFFFCSSLTSIEIPNSVTSIGERAFFYCENLTSIEIPNSVTSIGEGAFSSCSNITSVIIPNSVTKIGDLAFASCTGVTSISIPNSVTSIEGSAFYHVCNITYSGIATGSPWEARSINGYVDGLLVYNDDSKTRLLACSTKATGEILIPNSVTIIGNDAFYGCSNVTSVTIPNSVTSIGGYAFSNCSSLTSVTIGNSVTYIQALAFERCTGLTSIINEAATPPYTNNHVFYFVDKSKCVIYVPKESVELYKHADGWGNFTNIFPIIIKRKVTFVDYDETILSEQEVEEGEAATPPADPTRTGYTFTGWDKDFSNVTEDMTITAQYQINQYRVEFRDWDGVLLKEENVEYNSNATAPSNPSRDWYTFIGWDKDFSVITSDLVVTAQYKEGQIRDYILLFSQSPDNSEIASRNISFEVPAPPVITGYTFLRWIVVGGDLDDTIEIQAVYKADSPTNAPEVYTNPANSAQKLIRNGNVYVLTDDSRTYTVTGQQLK